VDGVTVDREGIDLLMVVEDDKAPEGAGTDDVAVRQDVAGIT
jgi:hypothetical protein